MLSKSNGVTPAIPAMRTQGTPVQIIVSPVIGLVQAYGDTGGAAAHCLSMVMLQGLSQVFWASLQLGPVQPAVAFAAVPVVRVTDPVTPTCEIAELAWTFVVPGTAEVITTVQLDDPTACA